MSRVEKHVEESVTCNLCNRDMTGQEIEDYNIYDVLPSQTIRLSIIENSYSKHELDICEECKARAMLISIIRRWDVTSKLYPLFKTAKDDVGMDTFVEKVVMGKWGHGAVDWISANWIRSKKKGKV